MLRNVLVVLLVATACAVVAAELAMRRLTTASFPCHDDGSVSVYVAGLADDSPVVARGCLDGEPFRPTLRIADGTMRIGVPEAAAVAFARAQAADPPERRTPYRGSSSAGGRLVLYDLRYEESDIDPIWRIADALAPTQRLRPWEHGFDEDGVVSLELPQPRIIVRGSESRVEFPLGGIELDDASDVHLIAPDPDPAASS